MWHVPIQVEFCTFPLIESYSCTCCVRRTFNALVWRLAHQQCGVIASLLAREEQFGLNSEGADICLQNVLTFMTFRRTLFWIVLAIALACSVLRERATFAIAFGRSERTLLELCIHATLGLCNYLLLWASHHVNCYVSEESEGWKLQVPWLVEPVPLASCRWFCLDHVYRYMNIFHSNFNCHKTRRQVQDWVQTLTAIGS